MPSRGQSRRQLHRRRQNRGQCQITVKVAVPTLPCRTLPSPTLAYLALPYPTLHHQVTLFDAAVRDLRRDYAGRSIEMIEVFTRAKKKVRLVQAKKNVMCTC